MRIPIALPRRVWENQIMDLHRSKPHRSAGEGWIVVDADDGEQAETIALAATMVAEDDQAAVKSAVGDLKRRSGLD